MQAGKRLNAGVIGLGWVATARHIPALQRLEDVHLTAVYDHDPARAQAIATKFGIPFAALSLEDLYHVATDFVSICTPPPTHAALAVQSLKAGRHVFIEKPMAMNPEEAALMAGMAAQEGLELCVSHNLLYSRSVSKALALLQTAGPIQHVMALQLSNPHRRLPSWYQSLPGGLFFDESPHVLYLVRRLLGELEVEGVTARLDVSKDNAIDFIEARLSNGSAGATLTMSFNAPVSEWRVTIIAERMVISLDLFRDMISVSTDDGRHGPAEVLSGSLGAGMQAMQGFVTSGALYSMNRLLYGHDRLIGAFVRSIGGALPPVRLVEAQSVVRITQEILRKAGVRVPVAERETVAA